jgi:oxygen-independent coproporphyrinogen-3 oxidase
VQALKDEDLQKLGRKHKAVEAIKAVKSAANIFDNFSFDLIYARSGQTPREWQEELTIALELCGNHISLYQLTIEKGTEFFNLHKSGKLVLPDDENAAVMYEITASMLAKKRMHRYEISNYAKTSDSVMNLEKNYCQHNMVYWRYEEYLGIGPGAHSRLHYSGSQGTETNVEAIMMHHRPEKWLAAVKDQGQGMQNRHRLKDSEVIEEMVMMGLRLSEGLYEERLKAITQKSFNEVINLQLARDYQKAGLLEFGYDEKDEHINVIRLTAKGVLLHSYLVPRLLLASGA